MFSILYLPGKLAQKLVAYSSNDVKCICTSYVATTVKLYLQPCVCVSLCEIEQVANMTKDFDLVQCISDNEVMFANNYSPPPFALFSYVFLGRLGWPSVTEVQLLAVIMVLYRERVVRQRLRLTYSSVLDALKIKIMEIASGLSFFRQDIPIVGSIAYAGWKESSRKCLSHKTLCLDGPFQRRECLQFSLLAESTAPYGGHRSEIKRS